MVRCELCVGGQVLGRCDWPVAPTYENAQRTQTTKCLANPKKLHPPLISPFDTRSESLVFFPAEIGITSDDRQCGTAGGIDEVSVHRQVGEPQRKTARLTHAR